MLRPALILGIALFAAACGDRQPATVNEAGGDAALTQETVVSGDVTAIDAATADDANMAADVPPPGEELGNEGSANEARPARERPRPQAERQQPAAEEEPAEELATGNDA